MCTSRPKVQQVAAPPTPAPAPTITPSEVSPQNTEDERRRKLDRLRYGMASLTKTGGGGITGKGAELASASSSGKSALGG